MAVPVLTVLDGDGVEALDADEASTLLDLTGGRPATCRRARPAGPDRGRGLVDLLGTAAVARGPNKSKSQTAPRRRRGGPGVATTGPGATQFDEWAERWPTSSTAARR
jgi:hypothetical protein